MSPPKSIQQKKNILLLERKRKEKLLQGKTGKPAEEEKKGLDQSPAARLLRISCNTRRAAVGLGLPFHTPPNAAPFSRKNDSDMLLIICSGNTTIPTKKAANKGQCFRNVLLLLLWRLYCLCLCVCVCSLEQMAAVVMFVSRLSSQLITEDPSFRPESSLSSTCPCEIVTYSP